jgi:hypothetical protein
MACEAYFAMLARHVWSQTSERISRQIMGSGVYMCNAALDAAIRPRLTEEVVVTTVVVVGAASGCLWVTKHFCAPETVSKVDVVRPDR